MAEVRYLLPWQPCTWFGDGEVIRRQLGKKYADPTYCEGRVYQYLNGLWVHGPNKRNKCFTTKQEAMDDIDREFIEMGFVLLSEERAKKLITLL